MNPALNVQFVAAREEQLRELAARDRSSFRITPRRSLFSLRRLYAGEAAKATFVPCCA